jgi:hypothetical protein
MFTRAQDKHEGDAAPTFMHAKQIQTHCETCQRINAPLFQGAFF